MTRNPLTVGEFLNQVKGILNDIPFFNNVTLVGEISNFNAHASGHFYFSLKDNFGRLSAVMFRSAAQTLRFKPKNGDRVVISGRFDMYPQTGQVQVYVQSMQLDGAGDLYIQYEALKKSYEDRGYFDRSHKKKLPRFPFSIAVICGHGSAAHADIRRTLDERWPQAAIHEYFALVQGDMAPQSLVDALMNADTSSHDVIILARGGGSIEDLWAFNTPSVIESVYNTRTPVISGIGHESDITLVDYVSDYSAATPTAAAHKATPNYIEVLEFIETRKAVMSQSVAKQLTKLNEAVINVSNRAVFMNPKRLFDHHWLTLDRTSFAIENYKGRLTSLQHQLKYLNRGFGHAMQSKLRTMDHVVSLHQARTSQQIKSVVKMKQRHFELQESNLVERARQSVILKKKQFSDILKALNYLSPLSVMQRGFSVVSQDNTLVRSINDVHESDELSVRVLDGTVYATVTRKESTDDKL